MDTIKKGMVFGVFDGLHEGHVFFLNEAKKLCQELFVVVAEDTAVEALKGKVPRNSLRIRKEALSTISDIRVIEGDEKMGEWSALHTYAPDVVFLGHDQQALAVELERLGVPHTFLPAHRPHEFKSSLLRGGA